jgi:hypothetical protein
MYGYLFVGERKETYAIDEESGPVVTAIYDKADRGWSTRRICQWLNESGTSAPSKLLWLRGQLPRNRQCAEAWSPQMVLDILNRESYTGRHSARRHESYKEKVRTEDGRVKTVKKRRIRPWSDQTRVAVTIPALISEEQWQRVQTMLRGRALVWEKDNPDQPLLNRGFAVCGSCKEKMIAARHSHDGVRTYKCPRRGGGRKPGDPNGTCAGGHFEVRAADADRDVWNKVKDIIRDDKRFQRLVQGKSAKLAARHAEAVQRAERDASELAETQAYADVVYKRMTNETDDRIYARHREELKQLNTAIADLQAHVAASQEVVTTVQAQRDSHQQLLELVDGLIAETREELAGPEDPHYPRTVVRREHAGALLARERIDEASLDSLDREQRRSIMRALEVRVPMYPSKHEFTLRTGKRWDFEFSDATLSSHASPRGMLTCATPRWPSAWRTAASTTLTT